MNPMLINDIKNGILTMIFVILFFFPFFVTLLMILQRYVELRIYQRKERIDLNTYYRKKRMDTYLNNKNNKVFTEKDIRELVSDEMLEQLKKDTYEKVINDLNVQKTKQQMYNENERFKLERAERRMKLNIDQIERKFGYICEQATQDYVFSHYMRQGEDFKYIVDFGNTEETRRTRKQDIDEIYTNVRSIINDDMFFDDLSLIYDLNSLNMEEYLKEHYIKGIYNQMVDDLIFIQKRNRVLEEQRVAKIMYESKLAQERWNSPEARAERAYEQAMKDLEAQTQRTANDLKEGQYRNEHKVDTLVGVTDRLLERYKDKPYLHGMIIEEVRKSFREREGEEAILLYPMAKALEYGIKGHELDSDSFTIKRYIKMTEDELNDMSYRLLPKEIIDKYKIPDDPYTNEFERMSQIRERRNSLIAEMNTNEEYKKKLEEIKYDKEYNNRSSYSLDDYLYQTDGSSPKADVEANYKDYADMVTFDLK